MHDTFLVHAICREVEEIASKQGAIKVRKIVLEVGDLSHFQTRHMQDTFEIFRLASPVLKSAELEFREGHNSEDIFLRDVELEVPD